MEYEFEKLSQDAKEKEKRDGKGDRHKGQSKRDPT